MATGERENEGLPRAAASDIDGTLDGLRAERGPPLREAPDADAHRALRGLRRDCDRLAT